MINFARRYPRSKHIFRALTVYPAMALAVGVVLWLTLHPAWPHMAPASTAVPHGWAYDASCCSNRDCRSVPSELIHEGPDGFTYTVTGQLIPYGDRRIKQSKDDDFHVCTTAGHENGRVLCIYEPVRGF
jgi:hypothetical protein